MNEKELINKNEAKNNLVDDKRRSLAKAGLAVAPLIMTLRSKSVLANECSISGMMSGNASNPSQVACKGFTPLDWKNNSTWPAPYSRTNPTKTIFSDKFQKDGSPCNRETLNDLTMIKILKDYPTSLHAEAVASLLNSASLGPAFGNTSAEVIAWWCDLTITNSELLARYQALNNRP